MFKNTTKNEASLQVLDLTAKITAAYVSNHKVEATNIAKVMINVHGTLTDLAHKATAFPSNRTPAVPVEESITPDYIVCLEDGKKLKMLKRHLKAAYNLTPQEYRERWGLPSDYPMVSSNYGKRRSILAKKFDLGKTPKQRKKAS
jgi:predicted transcriptional regulator